MSYNLSYQKKIELLEAQIKELNRIDFKPDRFDKLYFFQERTKKIFSNIFKNPGGYISKLENISFNSGVFDEPLPAVAEEDYFYSGWKSADLLLRSAIKDIEFEKELSEWENSNSFPVIYNTFPTDKTKVFIVHGHDEGLKNEVARFVERQGLEAIILHEQVSRSQTIIEKIESYSEVGFSIVLYTPCDIGGSSSSGETQPRARQNVIFEHGYFVAKLGRENVIALNKGDVEIPNDLSGMIYTSYEKDDWKRNIARELKASGYKIDFEKV